MQIPRARPSLIALTGTPSGTPQSDTAWEIPLDSLSFWTELAGVEYGEIAVAVALAMPVHRSPECRPPRQDR